MSRFASIRSDPVKPRAEEKPAAAPTTAPDRPAARVGKKAVSAYFTPEVSRALNLLALERGISLQALMGEAFDDLLRKYGKHPFGER